MVRLFLLLFIVVNMTFGGYTTPNTGVKWNFDSLVVHSAGAVVGAFPNFVVNDTVFVSPSDLLIVEKGSTIKISYRKGITIRGGLLAIGTKDSLITFTVSDSTWQELRFEDSAVDSLCRLEFCVVEYARLGLNFVDASPTVMYSTIKNTGTISGTLSGSGNYAIQCFNSNAILRYDSIYNNAQYGININSNSSPTIEHCVIFNNNLQGTAFKNQISIGPQGVNSPIIRSNEIYHTHENIKVGAISISALFSGSGSMAAIENNYLHHNAYGIALLSQGTSVMNAKIRNNTIVNNTYSDPFAAGSGINCYALSPSVNTSVIAENFIQGNLWGVTVQGVATPNLGDLSNTDTTDDGRNVVIDNKNRDTIFALYNNTALPLRAQNNYWGTSKADSVAQLIFDSSDIATLGKVTYEPFLPHSPILTVNQQVVQLPLFSLKQNFPNPFNPTTTISFNIRKSGFVSLKVYNLLGQEIDTLVEGQKEAGTTTVQWNASQFPSGVYFYRLQMRDHVDVKKMILLR